MAKRRKKATGQGRTTKDTRRTRAAAAGIGALTFGLLAWLTGGFTRENAMEWLRVFVTAGALALLFRWSVAEPFKIPSGSMEPTLHGELGFLKGDRVWVNKFVYGLRFPLNRARIPFTRTRINYADRRIWRGAEPQRFDVVVFKSVEEHATHATLVKRIIGLPGERIHIPGDGRVYVNGQPLELPEDMRDFYYTVTDPRVAPYGVLADDAYSLVPEGCYLLLGDNSAHSRDGRFFGWLPNEYILGRVACIWWPIPHWRDFTGFSRTLWWRSLVALIGLLAFWRLFWGRSWHVHDHALADTVARGDRLYVNRFAFGLPIPCTRARLLPGRRPRRGELVLYRAQPDGKGEAVFLLGRVAGLPGERVYLDDGRLLVNDAPLDAPASLAGKSFIGEQSGAKYARSKGKEYSEIPGGHYFILADNPEESPDSRALGWVAGEDLVGPVSVVWWPPTRWHRIRP